MRQHPELGSDFAKYYPEFDPYEVMLRPTTALLRKFVIRFRRLTYEPHSEYCAQKRKEAARLALEAKRKREADPEFDPELWREDQVLLAEEARIANPLEFYGYTAEISHIDDLRDDIRLMHHSIMQQAAGKNADQIPPYKPVHRPGQEIKSDTLTDDDEAAFLGE